ncbi:MAG: RluA family pseudouridine synthase [Acidimicrobiia bacterium]
MSESPSGEAPIEIEVPSVLVGERLDRTVALLFNLSRSAVASLISEGRVTVSGAVLKGSTKLEEGTIRVALPPVDSLLPLPDPTVKFEVVYADDALYVINKPAGLVVHPAPGAMNGTLVNGLLHLDPAIAAVGDAQRPGIVHRLDRDTSGLLIVARTNEAYAYFVDALSRHDVGRVYLALVHGDLADDQGVIDAPIGRDQRVRTRMGVRRDGKPARTAFQVLQRVHTPAAMTLVRCELETGRTHQIRVHLAAVKHPVIGDSTYAARRATYGIPRTFLHAAALSFQHPTDSCPMEFHAALPNDLMHWVKNTCAEIDVGLLSL